MSKAELFKFIADTRLVDMLMIAGDKKRAKALAKQLVKQWDRAHGGKP